MLSFSYNVRTTLLIANATISYFLLQFTTLEYYKYWNEIEKQFHDEDHDRLRERSVLQRSLIRAYEKLHAERMAQSEKEETEVI